MPPEEEMIDSQLIDMLQSIYESLAWIITFQVIIVCSLLFCLFFIAMKAGKK
jgi:hypothetical protein